MAAIVGLNIFSSHSFLNASVSLGKGVIIAKDFAEAEAAVKSMLLDGKFGKSGSEIVVEEFMTGHLAALKNRGVRSRSESFKALIVKPVHHTQYQRVKRR